MKIYYIELKNIFEINVYFIKIIYVYSRHLKRQKLYKSFL